MSTDPSIVEHVDNLFFAITGLSVVLLLGITAAMVYFVIRYSAKRHPKAVQIEGNVAAEVAWTVIPGILVMGMFYYGYEGFYLMRRPPEDALNVKVTARMWDWTFEYENGIKTSELYVPQNKAVKLSLTSLDVLHSFYLPAFRTKEDAVPGQQSFLWFKPTSLGPSQIFCAEYCGQRHAYMMSRVVTMKPDEFQRWYDSGGKDEVLPQEAAVLKLFDQHKCVSCHDLGSTRGSFRGLRGLLDKPTVVLRNGKREEIVADEAYIRRAIVQPDAEILEGYEGDPMPAPKDLSDADLEKMVRYLGGLQ